jgi:hypothetical protein
MDVQALAFAGVSVGFASVGIGGELTLIEIEIPVRGGAEIHGEKIPDQRPLQFTLPTTATGQVADVAAFGNQLLNLATTRWSGGFWYGAGMHAEILAGNINLQARIRLLFFDATFKQILAEWSGTPLDVEFVGSIQAVKDLQLPPEVLAQVTQLVAAGEDANQLMAMVPLHDEGFTGHFGTELPMIAASAFTASGAWPPAYRAGSTAVALPSAVALCGEPPPPVIK